MARKLIFFCYKRPALDAGSGDPMPRRSPPRTTVAPVRTIPASASSALLRSYLLDEADDRVGDHDTEDHRRVDWFAQ